MMACIRVKAPAKINLALDITGALENGYHLLEMVMQTIDLYDTITVTTTKTGRTTLACDVCYVPCDQSNIAVRCADLFFARTGVQHGGIHITIQKNIPAQAGLAGGSADGAGVLFALNRLFQTDMGIQKLCQMGGEIGADIPFCLTGGTAKVEGIGEKISCLPSLPTVDVVVAKPQRGVNTQRAFSAYDAQDIKSRWSIDRLVQGLTMGDLSVISAGLGNVLECVCPIEDVAHIKNIMLASGATGACMTGSGSAVFGLFAPGTGVACQQQLAQQYHEIFLCKPINHGVVMI